MDEIRRLVASAPLSRDLLDGVRARLLRLAAQRELFPSADFPPPPSSERLGSCLYRLSQDDDDRFALYLNACRDRTDSPAHDHTTWAVVVGFEGEELNRFYRRTAEASPDGDAPGDASPDRGVEETHHEVVAEGTGVTMLPDDLHSIHIRGGGLNFHLYGLALERLEGRRFFRAEDATWQPFPAHPDIREARGAGSERTGTEAR
jgi:predicted metal-dependent enzyme (double-stranded beta helix superfamily)